MPQTFLEAAKPASVTSSDRVFGNTVISWSAIGPSGYVRVSVTMGGAQIQVQTLTPLANQMAYNGASNTDWSKGQISASFGPYGTSGQLYGALTWQYQGGPGNYTGSIGLWATPQDREHQPQAGNLLAWR